MPRLQGAWPASISAAAPVVTGISAILAASNEVPRAIGVFAALFTWLLILPVWSSPQLAAVRAINLTVWVSAFVAPVRWVFFALTTALTLTLLTIGRRDPSGKYFSAPQNQAKQMLDDENSSFL